MASFGKLDLFLKTEAEKPGNARFVARNFLLDEGLPAERIAGYNELAGTGAVDAHKQWKDGHETYLTERIDLPRPIERPFHFDAQALVNCPETFGPGCAISNFGGTDPDRFLIRVFEAARMARHAPRQEQFLALVESYLASRTEEAGHVIEATISAWLETRNLRPVFAAFWEAVRDLMEDGPADWADQLRDRLGLTRFSPKGGEKIPVLIFRYPVRLVPKVGKARSDLRALVVPTVLDGPFSQSFCPAPAGQDVGFAVDLAAWVNHRVQEVVHPYVPLNIEHLYRIGYISREVPEDLSEARVAHLLWVQEVSRRPDYARMTDGDLLS